MSMSPTRTFPIYVHLCTYYKTHMRAMYIYTFHTTGMDVMWNCWGARESCCIVSHLQVLDWKYSTEIRNLLPTFNSSPD